jgi:drug/metabolite transporter (DMT)-like permease
MKGKPDVRLVLALVGVALIWGTTYLGIRVAVETIPPWFVTTMRQGIASLILFIILWRKKEFKWHGWPYLRRQFLVSFLMIVIGNGMTTVAEQSIPSGLTSLLNALSPLLVFVGSVFIGLQRPTLKGILGVVIGFLGVAFIFRDGIADLMDPNYRFGIICICTALTGWSIGTIYTKKNSFKTSNIFLDLFYQFLFSAVVQLGLALIIHHDADASTWTIQSLSAVVYLAIFGSVLAFFCYHYALKRVTATEVSVLSYFNTVIALFLGWLILNEKITFDILIATLLIILGVFITNYKKESKAANLV